MTISKLITLKRLNFVFTNAFAFAFLITLILGCSGSSANSTTGSPDNGEVKFKLDGVDWISGPPGHPELKFEEEAITDGSTLVRIEAFCG